MLSYRYELAKATAVQAEVFYQSLFNVPIAAAAGSSFSALNLLEGAAVITRAQQLRSYGVAVPAEAFIYRARPLG